MVAASDNLRDVLEARTLTPFTFFSIMFSEIELIWDSVYKTIIKIPSAARAAIKSEILAVPIRLNN